MSRVRLADLIDAIETRGQVSAYLDRQTGKVFVITEDDEAAAEIDGPDDTPDWQKESADLARQVAEDSGGRFLALPEEFDIDEWRMMEEFASAKGQESVASRLHDAIHGSGAFRRFKDAIHSLGIADRWHSFRADCYRALAIDWCKENGIEWDDDGPPPG